MGNYRAVGPREGRAGRRLVVALLVAVLSSLVACGTTTRTAVPTTSAASAQASSLPTASPTPPGATATATATTDPAAVYASIERQVEQIRGLHPRGPDTLPTLLDEPGVRRLVEEQFARSNPKAQLDGEEQLLKALGMLPADASLGKLETDLLSSQVAGMYDPDTKKLYVISRAGSIGPAERVTFAHEFTHELQDQNFGLKGLSTDQIGQGDQDLGRLALIEGDATSVMTTWQQQNLGLDELARLAQESYDPKALAVLAGMPPILRETLLFPYTAGLTFVAGLRGLGGWAAVDAAFSAPPDSTEQILHPEKYASHEKPIAVAIPTDLSGVLGAGWKSLLVDTLGEFQLRIWLQGAVPFSQATEAAAGWGGDRVELLAGPGGAWAVVLKTAWDTPTDATQFERAATAEAAKLGAARVVDASATAGPMILVASDPGTLTALERALLGAA